jgi:octaprenyl-diphosphate synthase
MNKKPRDTAVSLKSIQEPVLQELLDVQSFIRNLILEEFHFLREVAEHVTSMKGKLFRPTLLLLSGNLADDMERPKELVSMAVVVEMIHTATLVHDDFIDNASIRRGLQTLHDRWSEQVSIIMGDYLYSRSLVEMVSVGDLEVMRVMSEACRKIALGEMMELNLTSDLDQSEEQYYNTISHKTAALIRASCEGGAVLSNGEYRENMREYGENLGMAFQIVDDVFDYRGKSNVLGKVIGTDLREKKATLPLIHSFRNMDTGEREYMEELFSKKEIGQEDIEAVSRAIQKHGGFDYAMQQAASFAEEARKAIEDIKPSRCKDSLLDAVDYVVERDR